MTQYPATLVNDGSIPSADGNSIAVSSGSSVSYNEFMEYCKSYGISLSNIIVKATTFSQLSQPFYTNTKAIDGKENQDLVPVNVNVMQSTPVSNNIDFGSFNMTGLNSLFYTLLPNQSVVFEIKTKDIETKDLTEKKSLRRDTSLPITIIATNTSSVASSEVELFDAINTSRRSNVALDNTCVLSSNLKNITYHDIINSLLTQSYKFGMLRITVETAPINSVLITACDTPVYYGNKLLDGTLKTSNIVPSVNVMQSITNTRKLVLDLIVSSATSMRTVIPPRTSIKYEFLPKEKAIASGKLKKMKNKPLTLEDNCWHGELFYPAIGNESSEGLIVNENQSKSDKKVSVIKTALAASAVVAAAFFIFS
jgi:hypothetical protein